jgi:hypothetical protein
MADRAKVARRPRHFAWPFLHQIARTEEGLAKIVLGSRIVGPISMRRIASDIANNL